MSDQDMHVDPKRLREFAEQLDGSVTYYKKFLERLNGKISRLGRSWRDQEFMAFAKEMKTTQRIVQDFIIEAIEARRTLIEDADRAERYQRTQHS